MSIARYQSRDKVFASIQQQTTMNLYRQASHKTSKVLALPADCLNLYGDFVTKNASSVGQIEGALRSLTYIIPGKSRLRLRD